MTKMRRNKSIVGAAALVLSAVMIAGVTAFAQDALTIKDNKEYANMIGSAENSVMSLQAVGDNAESNVYLYETGSKIITTASKSIKAAKALGKQAEKDLEKAKKAEEKKKAEEEAAKKKAEEEKKAAEKKAQEEALASNPTVNTSWDKSGHLTTFSGVYYGPSGKETYYNLDMGGVISIMRNMGFAEDAYPYWVREDGCKMLGDYIMVACNLDLRPRGSLVETSLGTGIVCDTSPVFVGDSATQVDVAVTW